MRESIRVDQIRCERCVSRLADALSPIEGLTEARVEMGTSSIIVEYDESSREQLDKAIHGAAFDIIERSPLPPAEVG
jgi:copper chaperone CopZ